MLSHPEGREMLLISHLMLLDLQIVVGDENKRKVFVLIE
jgi:hypothetical protein